MFSTVGRRRYGLGSTLSDLTKIAGGLIPQGGGDMVGSAGSSVATAVIDNVYSKEQARIQKLLDDTDADVVKAGQLIDWSKVAIAGLAAAGIYLMVKRAHRA